MKNKPYPLYSLPLISDLKDMVCQRTAESFDEIAFSFMSTTGRTARRTFGEFSDDINCLGTYLFDKGYHGKHIAIIGKNSYEWLVAFMAIVNGGNIAVPIDKDLPSEKICRLLKQSDCCAAVVSKKSAALIESESLTTFSMSYFADNAVAASIFS